MQETSGARKNIIDRNIETNAPENDKRSLVRGVMRQRVIPVLVIVVAGWGLGYAYASRREKWKQDKVVLR